MRAPTTRTAVFLNCSSFPIPTSWGAASLTRLLRLTKPTVIPGGPSLRSVMQPLCSKQYICHTLFTLLFLFPFRSCFLSFLQMLFVRHFCFHFLRSGLLVLVATTFLIVAFPSSVFSFFQMDIYLLIKSPGGIFRAPRVHFELGKG